MNIQCTLAPLWAAAALWAPSQEGGAPPPLPEHSNAATDARDEMIQLFHKVERRLAEIDALLYDASTGQPSPGPGLASVAEAGIGELLERSQGESQGVLQDIDRILEIARQFGQSQNQSQGQGSCESALQGGSPLDQKPGAQGQKEETPEMMNSGQERPEPREGSEQPAGRQPNDPRDSVAPEGDSENRDASSDPPDAETGRVEVQDSSERWGDLPEHVRDLFRTEGGRDMPPQYRDWIDGYYRRLNQRP
jgi:hypothetical protein